MWTIEEWAKQATGTEYHKDGKTYHGGGYRGSSGIPLFLANVGYVGTEFMKLGNFQDYWQKWMREIGVSEKQSDDDSESDSESAQTGVDDLDPDEGVKDIDPGLTQAETPMFSDVSMATSRSKTRKHFSMEGYDTRLTKSRTALTRGDYRTTGQARNLQYS